MSEKERQKFNNWLIEDDDLHTMSEEDRQKYEEWITCKHPKQNGWPSDEIMKEIAEKMSRKQSKCCNNFRDFEHEALTFKKFLECKDRAIELKRNHRREQASIKRNVWSTLRVATVVEDLSSEEAGKRKCRWDDGASFDANGCEILQLHGPGKCWRQLAERGGYLFNDDYETVGSDKKKQCWVEKQIEEQADQAMFGWIVPSLRSLLYFVRHWQFKDEGETQEKSIAGPALLTIEKAARAGQHGLLSALLESEHVPKVFGTKAVQLLIEYKWNKYGASYFRIGVIIHASLVIAWQYLTWTVAHWREIEGEGTLFFTQVTGDHAVLAASLCFVSGAVLYPGTFTEFEAKILHGKAKPKEAKGKGAPTSYCLARLWENKLFLAFVYLLRGIAVVAAFFLLHGHDSFKDAKLTVALVLLLWTAAYNMRIESMQLWYCYKCTSEVTDGNIGKRIMLFTLVLAVITILALLLDSGPLKLLALSSPLVWLFKWSGLCRIYKALVQYMDLWNFVDVVSLTLVYITAWRLILHADRGTTSQIAAVNTTFLWFRTIHYMSGWKSTATFVRMFTAISLKMFTFLAMLAIFVAGNSFVLLLLYPRALAHDKINGLHPWNLTTDQETKIDDLFGGAGETLFTSFNMMFMSSDTEILDRAYSPTLAKILYAYYVVVVPLIMLNLLIALMGGEYDKVKEGEEFESTRLRAELLLGFEQSMTHNERRKPEWHPRWIHALLPRQQLRDLHSKRLESRNAREEEEKSIAGFEEQSQSEFENQGFFGRVNISLNTVLRKAGEQTATESFELRTLGETSIEKVLPDEAAQEMLADAAAWTDIAAAPKPFDPFIGLSKEHACAATTFKIEQPAKKFKTACKLMVDQITNLLSKSYASGHVGLDNNLNYITESYIWGITMEKVDSSPQSQKYRVLLIKESLLEKFGEYDEAKIESLIGSSGSSLDPYIEYKRRRAQNLKRLSRLYTKTKDGSSLANDRLFLAGRVEIAVPCPGGGAQSDDREHKLEALSGKVEGIEKTMNEILQLLQKK